MSTPSVGKKEEAVAEARTAPDPKAAEKTAEALETGTSANKPESPVAASERRDHLETVKAAQVGALNENGSDTLRREQLDHQRTLAEAAGLSTREVDEDTLLEAARENAARIEANGLKKLPEGDAYYEGIPSNWIIEADADDETKVKATNRVTGRSWEGDAGKFGAAIAKFATEGAKKEEAE